MGFSLLLSPSMLLQQKAVLSGASKWSAPYNISNLGTLNLNTVHCSTIRKQIRTSHFETACVPKAKDMNIRSKQKLDFKVSHF